MNQLLVKEQPMYVMPALVKSIGLEHAVLLQQLHIWSLKSKTSSDGYRWVQRRYEKWMEELTFWTLATFCNVFESLVRSGFVIGAETNTAGIYDNNRYRLDYGRINFMTGATFEECGLLTEVPLYFQASLADKIGLDQAVFIQRLQYLLSYSGYWSDSILWVVTSKSDFVSRFDFWPPTKISKLVRELGDNHIVKTIWENPQIDGGEHFLWLTINYDYFGLVNHRKPEK